MAAFLNDKLFLNHLTGVQGSRIMKHKGILILQLTMCSLNN
jgi:hypothetical protein